MTDDEFQRSYHEYDTDDKEAAIREALSVTLENGQHPIVVGLPLRNGMRYCLMLPRTTERLAQIASGIEIWEDE